MYSYPELLSQLKVGCSVAEFMSHINATPWWSANENSAIALSLTSVVPLMPWYTHAVCPVCQTSHRAQLNTYTLFGWGYNDDFSRVPYPLNNNEEPYPEQTSCPHYLGVDAFLNLHHNPPSILNFHNDRGEIPYIIPWMVTHRLPGYAVIHALPICRIESGAFIPSYTVFMVAYFLQDRRTVWHEHWEAEVPKPYDPEWYPWLTDDTRTNPTHPDPYDLAAWAKQGTLGWLDYTQPTLPLHIGVGLTLPSIYAAIAGDKHSYQYLDGVTKKSSS